MESFSEKIQNSNRVSYYKYVFYGRVPKEEIESAVNYCILTTYRNFNPELGYKPETYFSRILNNTLLNLEKREKKWKRQERAGKVSYLRKRYYEDQSLNQISEYFSSLPEIQARVLEEYYNESRTLGEIAKRYNLSIQRIFQIKEQGLEKIKSVL